MQVNAIVVYRQDTIGGGVLRFLQIAGMVSRRARVQISTWFAILLPINLEHQRSLIPIKRTRKPTTVASMGWFSRCAKHRYPPAQK